MMNKNYTFVFGILLLVLTLSFISAQGFKLDNTESIGTFKVNTEVQLTNFCSTANCTYANLTQIIYPNGTIQNMNDEMTKEGNTFNYSYTPTELGEYYFITCSNPNGIANCDKDSFKVTPEGYDLSSGLSLILIGVLVIILTLLIITIRAMILVDNFGWNFGFLNIAYLLLNVFFYTSWKVFSIFLYHIPTVGATLHSLWTISNIIWIPFILGQVFYILIKITEESQVKRLVKMGYTQDEASSHVKRRK